jgi:transcription termination/antitermination protein NusA
VPWDDNPAQLVINSIAPAEVASIVVDEDRHTMDVAVREDQLSQAIGRSGQNVRLASQLTGWTINIMTEAQAAEKNVTESEGLLTLFTEQLGVDAEVAEILIREGFTSIEDIAYAPKQEMLNIEEFDEEISEALRDRAKDILLTKAIAGEESPSGTSPADDLLNMEGMTRDLAFKLAGHGIVTMEDLAEQSVDDLIETVEELNQEQAAKLIMTARAPWFE